MDAFNRLDRRRAVLAGAAGLGLAGLVGGSLVTAQATPDAGDQSATGTTTTGTTPNATDDHAAEAAARYDDFVMKLAANLSIADSTTVDTAIRSTLTDIVDEHLAAGEISANDADAAKTAIASSPAPIFGALSGGRGRGPAGRPGWFGGMERPGNGDGPGGAPADDDTTTEDATPAAGV